MEELDKEISKADEQTKTEQYLVLPDSVDGEEVKWRYETRTRAAAAAGNWDWDGVPDGSI